MKGNRLRRLAGKILPIGHGHYREMCSLAATGQLGGPQMCELNEHIAACHPCRMFLESIAQVSMQVMPAVAESRVPARATMPPHGMRIRFLSRLAADRVRSVDRPASLPVLIQKSPPDLSRLPYRTDTDAEDSGSRSRSGGSSRHARLATILAACAVIGVVGFYAGRRTSIQAPKLITQMPPTDAPSASENRAAEIADRVKLLELEQRKKDVESRLREMKERVITSETQQKALTDRLTDANRKLAELAAASVEERQRLMQEDQLANGQLSELQGEVEKLRSQLDDARTRLVAQQGDTEQLRARLELTEANLQQQLSLQSAKGEMGELVAARNLHIVDVYDADPSGKRQRSFGRVFYIEGKSLVFYAYDLEDSQRVKTNVVFHVWGGKAGVKEVTHSLGILRKENEGQSRWAMTFDDAKVLSQINTVFVTAESASKQNDEPRGKKVLYAYFGSPPNHP
jgi:predicted  nucleic acid-binding Zn-ribbon protein